jgi:hypothetical protein
MILTKFWERQSSRTFSGLLPEKEGCRGSELKIEITTPFVERSLGYCLHGPRKYSLIHNIIIFRDYRDLDPSHQE